MRKKISSRNYFLVRRFAKFITHYALQSHEGMTGGGGGGAGVDVGAARRGGRNVRGVVRRGTQARC